MCARPAWQLTQVQPWWVLCRHRHSQDVQTSGFAQDKCTSWSWRLVNFSRRRSSCHCLSCHCSQQKGKRFLLSCSNMPEFPPVDGIGRDNHSESTECEQLLCVCLYSFPSYSLPPGTTGSLSGKLTQHVFKAVALIIWHLLDTCHFHTWAQSPACCCFPPALPNTLWLWEGGHLAAPLLLLSSSTSPSFRDCNTGSV